MKLRKLILFVTLIFVGCNGRRDYNPATYLTPVKQDEVMWKVIRYMARPPENLTFEERFYKGYDDHYHEQMALHRLDAYYIGDDEINYFLVSRRAPSLTEKRVAIGGKLRLNKDGSLVEYKEVFRTWKMVPDTLAKRSAVLFDKLVNGGDLTPYYTKNSKGVEYIEFPDDITYFDVSTRVWKTKQ